jgi:hypothetical protein
MSDALRTRLAANLASSGAAIVYQFCQAGLHGRAARAAHLDAPVRLWQ